MKFGVNTWVWTSPLDDQTLDTLAPKIAGMGFDILEVPLENLDDLDHARAAEVLQRSGLGVTTCVAMGPDRDLIHPDDEIRKNGVAYIKGAVDAAEKLGATNLVGPIYSAVGRTWQATPEERTRDLGLLVEQLKPLAEYAGKHGVVMCIEPLNRFETSFINLAEQAIEVVERVNSPSCQIMLDTFHMNIEEKSLGEAIRAVGSRLHHLHSCGNDRGAPGADHIPWGDVVQGLRDIQYDGPVVIESFTAKVKSIARAAAIWRPLAVTQDAIAVDGLKFLKEHFA